MHRHSSSSFFLLDAISLNTVGLLSFGGSNHRQLLTMHPPLDRPHPDCQAVIEELRSCQETRSAWKVWACNEVKYRLDICFREEKERMLKELNKDIVSRRAEEEAQAALSTGQNITFAEYLKKDKAYQKEMEDIQKKKSTASGWF